MPELKNTVRLFKKDSKGKIRVLYVYAEGNEVVQVSGLLTGKYVERRSACVGKNIGKANETTPNQQALLEAKSKYDKKLREGYFKTLEEANNTEVILPMLAKPYEKESKKVDWTTAYVQPKLDGIRCLNSKKGKISRKNVVIDTMDHIKVPDTLEHVIDGELYAHGLSFQENMKIIKKVRSGTKNVKHHVYDMILDKPFEVRYELLKNYLDNEGCENLELVPTYKVESEEEMNLWHEKFLAQGYEGTMLRWGTGGYQVNKRSSYLLKVKDFLDIACRIINVLPSEKMPNQAVFICELDGIPFGCGMKFSHKEREEFLTSKDEYIGKTAEIRFFEYTDDGLPRFPVCVGIRIDK